MIYYSMICLKSPPERKAGVFKKFRFRDGLVWTIGLTVEIQLRFQLALLRLSVDVQDVGYKWLIYIHFFGLSLNSLRDKFLIQMPLPFLKVDKSYFFKSGWASISINIGGVPNIQSHLKDKPNEVRTDIILSSSPLDLVGCNNRSRIKTWQQLRYMIPRLCVSGKKNKECLFWLITLLVLVSRWQHDLGELEIDYKPKNLYSRTEREAAYRIVRPF